MIVKFLSTRNGGGSGSIDYALNQKRIENGTARILKGDERMTRDLIATITKKQKTSFAVMSFEEANIPEEQKRELMSAFELTFFAGLRPDQYNVLWVEHTDKGRLELNAIIPKIELSTGKAYNPYNHKTDLHIKDLFTKSVNLKYGFSDPQDPAKTASVSGSKKEIRLFHDYNQLDQQLKQLVADGAVQDRSELITLLQENGIEVTRQGEDYISIKLPESKKARRFSGTIYEKQFTSIDELRDIRAESTQREGAFAGRNREVEYGKVSQRLSDAVSKRAEYNTPRYAEPKKRERAIAERVAERAREKGRELERNAIVLKEDNRSSQKQQQETREARESIDISSNQKNLELNNDRIRSAVAEYARDREARSRARARRSSERTRRIAEYASVSREATETDYRAIEEAHGWRQLRGYVEKIVRRLSNAFDAIANAITERTKNVKSSICQSREEAELQKLFDRDKDEQLFDRDRSEFRVSIR